jgi:predicted transposase YbfD/YdcC
VDTFVDPATKRSIALAYLESIGVDPRAIKFAIATHWDSDHIRGFVQLVEAAEDAEIVLSSALKSPDFVHLAFRHQQRTYASPLGSGTREFVNLVELLMEAERKPTFASRNTTLAEYEGLRLIALSPSSEVTLDALSATFVAALESAETGDSVVEPTPNAASLVLTIRWSDCDILLGADLEKEGWPSAMSSTTAQALEARMFKVPHHGSCDADEPAVWIENLAPDAVYALTRFNNGSRSLPTDADRDRMRDRNTLGHIVGPAPSRLHLHGVVGHRVRAATRNGVWRATGPVGHYRWRRRIGDDAASVVLDGVVEPI